MTYRSFEADILRMNATYKLAPIDTSSWHAVTKRLAQFEDILSKECAELDDIQNLAKDATDTNWPTGELPMQILVHLGDLLGDLVIYCMSEAARWQLPMPQILQIIMASNTSKLGADGQPISNPENGKFEKGPNYWKPEPAIKHLLMYGGNGMQFTKSESGVTLVQMWEPNQQERGAHLAETVLNLDMDAVTAAALQQNQPKKET